MLIVLYRITDVERLASVDMLKVLSHIECNTVEHLSGCIVHKLKLDVLEIFTHELTSAEVHHPAGAEHRLLIARSEGVKSP